MNSNATEVIDLNIRYHDKHDGDFIKSIDMLVDCYVNSDSGEKEWIVTKLSYLVAIMLEEAKQKKTEKVGKQNSLNNIIIFPGCCQEGGNIKT